MTPQDWRDSIAGTGLNAGLGRSTWYIPALPCGSSEVLVHLPPPMSCVTVDPGEGATGTDLRVFS